ncbi:Protein lin-32 [Trichinella pseudospiralis]|uniref:Protein lin-32 n=1 Tax=Trichinella pseudospiralis TaxID=6337 RepID=A0A0V0Y8R4_TRIPS|nr:Protein lin-32 [Trichinella pseudospiralis]
MKMQRMRREKVGHIRICGARGRLRRQTELSNCHAWIVIMPVCQSTLIGQNWLYSLEKHQCVKLSLLEMDTTNSYSQMVSCGQEPFTNRQQFTYRTASNRWMPYAVPTDRLHGYVDDAANLSYQTLYGYESPGDYNNRDFVNPTSVYHQQQQQQQQLQQQQQQQSVMFQQNEAYSTKSTACTSWLNNNTTAVENANSQNNASSSSRNNSGNSSSSSSSNNNNSNKRALSHMHTMAGQPEMRRRRLAANERERRRMNSLNGAFDNLRNVLPSIESGKNLSKIETLLMAQEYIRVLQELIGSNKQYRSCGAVSGTNICPLHSTKQITANVDLDCVGEYKLKKRRCVLFVDCLGRLYVLRIGYNEIGATLFATVSLRSPVNCRSFNWLVAGR